MPRTKAARHALRVAPRLALNGLDGSRRPPSPLAEILRIATKLLEPETSIRRVGRSPRTESLRRPRGWQGPWAWRRRSDPRAGSCCGQMMRARFGSFGQPRRQSADDRFTQAVLARARGCLAYGVGELFRHGTDPADQLVGINVDFLRELPPLAQSNSEQLVFATHLHGELDLVQVDSVIRQDA